MVTKDKPIRILQVFSRMDKGGAETMIMTYYRKIDRSKVQFDFLVHTEEHCAFDDEIEELGGKIFRLPRYTGRNHFHYQKLWKDFLISHPEYQIIHGHFFTISAIYFQVAQKLGRICIAHSHISNVFKDSLVGLIKYSLFIKPIKRLANYYFACSIDAGKWMYGNKGVTNDKFFVMNNAIEADKFSYNPELRNLMRQELDIENKFVVGHIGRFTYQKNHSFLIDIFFKIKEKREDSILLLVGDGELKPYISQKVKDLGLTDSVIFTGVRSDVPNLLNAMDIFLFPSRYEGLGIVLVEAQTAGLKSYTSKGVVPIESKVTELLDYIELTKSADFWAKHILNSSNYKRQNKYQEVIEKGYDIKSNVSWIQKFYLSLV